MYRTSPCIANLRKALNLIKSSTLGRGAAPAEDDFDDDASPGLLPDGSFARGSVSLGLSLGSAATSRCSSPGLPSPGGTMRRGSAARRTTGAGGAAGGVRSYNLEMLRSLRDFVAIKTVSRAFVPTPRIVYRCRKNASEGILVCRQGIG